MRIGSLRAAEVVKALRLAGAPCSEMNDTAQMLAHEQVSAMKMVHGLPVDGAENHKVIALPLSIDGERSALHEPPPALGKDTDGLLAEAGYSEQIINRFRDAKIIG
jgi:crotonobetainyl-CoA:carnitine CoA-transferase CaiB-like acyl-CoA transferase